MDWKESLSNIFDFEETEKRLTEKMKELMKENEAPEEQYIRLGLQE